jgi:Tfp pilus assembly protein PilO
MRTLQSQIGWCARAQWVLGSSMVAFVAAFYFFGYRPSTSRLAEARMQTDVKQRELLANQEKTKVRTRLEQEVNDKRRRLERFDKQLPRQMEWGQFMNDITLLREQSGVRNWDIVPTGAKPDELFVEVPIEVKFEGDFLSVFSFLRQMEQMQRLTRVRDLTLTGTKDGTGQVDVKLSMNIYYLEH